MIEPTSQKRRVAVSVEKHKERSGHIRFRVRPTLSDGSRPVVAIFDNEADARERADATADVLADGGLAAVGGVTLAAFGEKWLMERELTGDVRDIANEQTLFRKHIVDSTIGGRVLAALSRREVKDWAAELRTKKIQYTRLNKKTGERLPIAHPKNGQKMSKTSAHKVLALLKLILAAAVDDEIVPTSVAATFKLKRETRTHEARTHLEHSEQVALICCEQVPECDRLLIAVALTTGIRPSEMAWLRLEDVHVGGDNPHVTIRFSRNGAATKTDEIRDVKLLPGLGLDAMKRWLELLPTYCKDNPLKLAFPYPSGARRQIGGSKFFHCKKDLWSQYLKAAGIERPVRFYDLRHTAATSLVSGLWSRSWSLAEAGKHLGHSTTSMTEHYGHMAESAYSKAARETVVRLAPPPKPAKPRGSPAPEKPSAAKSVESFGGSTGTRTLDLRVKRAGASPTVTGGWESRGACAGLPQIAAAAEAFLHAVADGDAVDTSAFAALVDGELAPLVAAAEAVAKGGPFAMRRAIELACQILELFGEAAPAQAAAVEGGA